MVRPVVQQVDQGTLLTLVYVDNRGPEISLSSNTKIYVRIAFKQGNPIHMGEHIIIEEKNLRDGEAHLSKGTSDLKQKCAQICKTILGHRLYHMAHREKAFVLYSCVRAVF